MDQSHYIEKILAKRQDREKRLLATQRNWFSLVGLFDLLPGENAFGSDPANPIALPSAPAPVCGSFFVEETAITLKPALDTLRVNGELPSQRPIQNDHAETPDIITCGSLQLLVIQRGEKNLLRVWDSEAQAVKKFSGLKYYPVNTEFKFEASFSPYATPLVKKGSNAIGTELEVEFIGQARFTYNGVDCTLDAQEDEDGLFFHFSDETRKDTTYPGGRYLLTAVPVQGKVTLDFNQAVNWPCAYTSFATCPLTPAQNVLPVRIKAGEMRYHD